MNGSFLRGGLAVSMACAIWGGLYVVSKAVMNVFPPLPLVWLRFLMSTCLMAPVALWQREKITRADFLWLILSSLPGFTLSIVTQFVGTELSSAALGSLITASAPAFIVLLAPLVLRERVRLPQVAALAVATAGVALVVGLPGTAGPPGGMFLWNWAFARLPAAFASLFFFVQPLTGTILSHFFLGEPVTGRFLAGSLLITAGVLGAGLNLPGRQGTLPLSGSQNDSFKGAF